MANSHRTFRSMHGTCYPVANAAERTGMSGMPTGVDANTGAWVLAAGFTEYDVKYQVQVREADTGKVYRTTTYPIATWVEVTAVNDWPICADAAAGVPAAGYARPYISTDESHPGAVYKDHDGLIYPFGSGETNDAPSAVITSPSGGWSENAGGTLTISGTWTDPNGDSLSGLVVRANGSSIGSATVDPGGTWTIDWVTDTGDIGAVSLTAVPTDSHGLAGSASSAVAGSVVDGTAPVLTAFGLDASYEVASLPNDINITTPIAGTDNVGITNWWRGTSSGVPALGDSGWTGSATAPTQIHVTTEGSQTWYIRARDAAGNISDALSDTTSISLPAAAPVFSAWTVPALSGATVAVTGIAFTGTCTHMKILSVVHGAAAPAKPAAGDSGWIATASTYDYTVALDGTEEGDRDLYIFGKNGASGPVSNASTAAECVVTPEAWQTTGALYSLAVAPWGTLTVDESSPPVATQIDDMAPLRTGKTAPFHFATSNLQFVDGKLHSAAGVQRKASCAAVELVTLLAGTNKPCSVLIVRQINGSTAGGFDGFFTAQDTALTVPGIRIFFQQDAPNTWYYHRYDPADVWGYGLDASTGLQAYLFVYDGASCFMYSASGGTITGETAWASSNAINPLVAFIGLVNSDWTEHAAWDRALTADEITLVLGRAARRWSIPLS
jgi:hypothetical protein